MDLGLGDKRVLVTGGSRGIGLAIACGFAGEGAAVAICGRNEEQLAVASGTIEAAGGRDPVALAVDLTDPRGCEHFVSEAAERLGGVDVLVNNAAPSTGASVADGTEDDLLARFNGKFVPALRCARLVLPYMRDAGWGSIVFIGGTAARYPVTPFHLGEISGAGGSSAPAGIANAAIANLVKHLSDELAPDEINVNCVHPGLVRSDRFEPRVEHYARLKGISVDEAKGFYASLHPRGRIVEPAEVAAMVVFIASEKASGITGQTIAVEAGMTRGVNY
jgi:NAD(P)-dependent dehydrogenase (short-subunit alcohol dehydrogenase family)